MINAGRLRERITIQQVTYAQNAVGERVPSWSEFKTVWAAVEPVQGREFWASQQIQSEVTIRVRIRYLSGVVPDMRILFGSRVLNIKSVINPKERNEEMQLMCTEGVDNG